MIGRLLVSAAFVVALSGTAMAQMTAPPASNPTASPSANDATGAPTSLTSQPSQPAMSQRSMPGSASTGTSGLSSNRQTAQGHEQENGVADKLNACEAKP